MLKRGIVTRGSLDRPRTRLGARRHASLLLLRDLAEEAESTPHYDTVIRLVRMANGTWRDTFPGRLTALDEQVASIVRQRSWTSAPLRVADVGASSGATSVELYETLRRVRAVDFVASDRWRDVFAVRPVAGGPTVVLDADGNPVQYVVGGFVLPGQGEEPWFYPVNRVLRRRMERGPLAGARAALAACDRTGLTDFSSRTLGGLEITRVPLLSPDCLRCVCERADFRFEVADVLRTLPWTVDVLRAVNILTPFHFEPTALRVAVATCLEAVAEGGLLVLGRSQSDRAADLRTTIWERASDGLRVLARLGGGAEVEDLVTEIARDTTSAAPRAAGVR
jgi:hypothetical protein